MGEGSDTDLTLVLPGVSGACAFSRHTERWFFDDGRSMTFQQLHSKYTELSPKLICRLLDAPDHRVLRIPWGNEFSTKLDDVVSDLINNVFKNLNYDGELRPIKSERGAGYQLNSLYVKQVPVWLLLAERRVAVGRSGASGVTPGELPRLRWIEQLVDLVRAGKWTQVRMLPGNGAEHVYDILVQNLSGARILPIDLAPINDRDELLRIIADQADEPATAFAADGRANFHQIAKRAAEGSDRLAIVVENWGSFAHEKTPDDLHQIALALTGFKNVTDRPKVAIVLLSPTRAHHLLPAHRVGSLLQLQSVFPSETDGEEIERWARSRLLDVAEDDIRAVLSAARGQLCAIQVAVNPALRNQNERLQAIRHAHHDAGQSILGTVGTCCREVLLGNSREPGCLTALKEAGILEERAGEYHPHVAEWTDSWGEARRSH